MRMVAIVLATLLPSAAVAQGAVEESLGELGAAVRLSPPRRVLPERADLSATLPPPRSQGSTQSCTSWSATYGAATQAWRRNDNPAAVLSPAFTYNQVSDDPYCQRATRISTTLDLLRDVGALPMSAFAFDGGWCGRRPSPTEFAEAARYRIRAWSAFDASDPVNVKGQIAEGRVVIVSMPIGSALHAHRGDGVFATDSEPTSRHALLAIGYDDARQAFRIQNSWGRDWGDGGYAWFGYPYWREKARTGFVID